MGKVPAQCQLCYDCYGQLPVPSEVLAPADSELNYYLWSPGCPWEPEPSPDRLESRGYLTAGNGYPEDDEFNNDQNSEAPDREDMEKALEQLVPADEMRDKFQASAVGGYMDSDGIAKFARQLGLTPSNDDIAAWKAANGDKTDYKGFKEFSLQCTHPEDNAEEFAQLFAFFDTNHTGKLQKNQILNILSTFGDPLTSQEEAALAKQFNLGETVDYRDFAAKLMAS